MKDSRVEAITTRPQSGALVPLPHGDLLKLSTEELLQKFGSGGHKPGSGSAAALLSLVSCKLLQTVVALTSGRDRYVGVKEQLTLVNQDILQSLEPSLMSSLQQDSIQFNRVIEARRERDGAKDSKTRKALGDKARAELRKATEIPLDIARHSLSLAEKAVLVFDLGFRSARGDSGVALSAAISGAFGSLSVVYLNLSSFKKGEWAVRMRKEADELNKKAQDLQVELLRRISQLQEGTGAISNEEHQGFSIE